MATPRFNSKSPTIKRILREAAEISHSPSADYHASPASDSDLFEWHFTLRGPPSSAFANGIYHGRIVLPPTYPLRPPSFRFLTPSGRFEANREICLSISGHHEETWQPAWGIRTALVALRSFMETDAKGQLGGLECSKAERERIAEGSGNWKCGVCTKSNREILAECEEAVKEKEKEGQASEDVAIPTELKMGYKDEMGKAKDAEEGKAKQPAIEESKPSSTDTASAPPPTQPYPPARPAQTVPQPTGQPQLRVQPLPTNTQQPAQTQAQVVHGRFSDGVPLWIDRSIAGIVVLLVVMVLKILLGL